MAGAATRRPSARELGAHYGRTYAANPWDFARAEGIPIRRVDSHWEIRRRLDPLTLTGHEITVGCITGLNGDEFPEILLLRQGIEDTRRTLAHELGHWTYRGRAECWDERLMDEFAAGFLAA